MANNETTERARFPAFLMSDTRKTLRWRIISSTVLVGLALGALAPGPRAMAYLGGALAMLMGFEWIRKTAGPRGRAGMVFGAWASSACLLLTFFFLRGDWSDYWVWATFGLAMAWAFSHWPGEERVRRGDLMAGLLYIVLALAALISLRMEPGGAAIILWLFAIAWAGDTGAYIVGKGLGQRALPVWISGDKTWEGLAGGALAGALAGTVSGHFATPFGLSLPELAPASAALAVAGQLGDCLESAAKRRLGVKDMSGLIPGHGGVLDRLDSMLAILITAGGALAVSRWPW